MQSLLAKHQITQVTQPSHSLDLALWDWLLAFSKTKITFEREEISDHQWDWGKYNEAVDGNWENCVRSQCAYLEGDWGIIVLCTMFLVPCIFFNNVSIFHSTWLDTFWTDLIYRFQVYNSIIHHLYIILCVHYPKSSLLPSPFIPLLPSPTCPQPCFPLVINILLCISRFLFFCRIPLTVFSLFSVSMCLFLFCLFICLNK